MSSDGVEFASAASNSTDYTQSWCARSMFLRQYPKKRWPRHGRPCSGQLAPGGLIPDGTCDELLAAWAVGCC